MYRNLEQMIEDAGVPSSEQVLLLELQKVKEENYRLTVSLRKAREDAKEARRDFRRMVRKNKNQKKRKR